MARVTPADPRPPYIQIADDLRSQVSSGDLAPGDKLPSVRELAESYGVSPMTVHHALRTLRGEGLLTSWQGRGVFVREKPPESEASGADEAGYEEIMRRLDVIDEGMRQIGERLDQLEADRSSKKGRTPGRRGGG